MNKKRILVIEDDPDMRLAFHVRLKANDFDVVHAGDAVASIAEARRTSPDLILLDLGLPGGSGFVVMERLKANIQLSTIPVIVVSARDRAANEANALLAGAEAYLQKPVDNQVLLDTIRRVICLN
jgi:DNA-binding response OmpR family regulator